MGGGGKGGSGGSSSTTQKVEPWEGQQPALSGLIDTAGTIGTGGYFDEASQRIMPFQDQQGNANFYGTMFAPDYYSGQTVAGQDPYTIQAIQQQAQRAMSGSGYNTAAGGQLNSTLAGNYLNSPVSQYAMDFIGGAGGLPDFLQAYNGGQPTGGAQANISQWQGDQSGYLDSMVGRAQNQTLANTAAGFSKSGRYGSGAHEAAAHDAAGNIANQMYGQAYEGDQNRSLQAHLGYTQGQLQNASLADNAAARDAAAWNQHQSNLLNAYTNSQNLGFISMNMLQNAYDKERGNMMTSMQYAPTLANQDYQDIAALSEAGAANEGRAQSLINAEIDKYNYNAAIPLTAMQNYGSMISGNYGMTGTNTAKGAQGSSNPLGGVMSGALGGAALGKMTGMGSGYGAAGGGLMGLLSGFM